ncbi:MAG TPA: serine/threonine-protein kinase [Thermoanaerobaculia bacterium]|jgi:serine/threonine protein kinase/Tfp pilus assembly protein PilF|nr:serine/threonine-protein kinase [Thermoanaerobaculia bacterium]
MHPEEWQEVKRIVDRALELPEEEREAFLAAIEDEALRQAADDLLRVPTAGADAFDHLRLFPAARLMPFRDGDTVGPYTIVKALDRGGMGAVFKAKDTRNGRVVALKILPPNALSYSRNEDKAQARLKHRYIATLYDSDTTPEGFRYVAMEYVEGIPITAFAEADRPTLRGRLELFRQVCEAVEHAHQKLVVHRDLKPDNILVTAEGEPKLLDFGIAKILSPTLAARTLTRSADRPFTLAYASPEQLGGMPTDTRTDVYSLGVLLCVLLTSRLPYRAERSHDLPQAILALEPVRPSALALSEAVSPSALPKGSRRRLRRLLEGELDAIVLRALRKEPAERYRSVAELSEDVRRYLDREPVLALKGTSRYRMRKFLERHRLPVAAALLGLLVLIGFTVALFFLRQEALSERDAAQREAKRSEAASGFLVDMFKVSNPWTTLGSTVSAREVLDEAARKLQASPPRDPAVRGTLLRSLGRINLNLGNYAPAETLLEPALKDIRAHYGGNPRLIAETLADLATVRYHQARYADAERYAAETLSVADVSDAGETLEMRSLIGRVAFARGDFTRAEKLFRTALADSERLGGPQSLRAASAVHDLACTLHAEGKYAEASACYGRSLAIRRKLLGENHHGTLQVLHNLACLTRDQGNSAKAETELVAIRLGYRAISDPNYPSMPTLFHNIGATLLSAGKLDEAEPLLFDSLAGYRWLFPDNHPHIARALAELGRLFDARRHTADAERYYRNALGRLERSLGKGHPDTITVANNYAAFLAREGRGREADGIWRELLYRMETHPVREDLAEAIRENLAAAHRSQKGDASDTWRAVTIEMLDLTETPDYLEAPDRTAPLSLAGKRGAIRFFDDFNDGLIDPGKWEVRGNTVLEEGGKLRVLTTVTDQGGQARTLPFPIDSTQTLIISRRVKVHASNEFLDGKMVIGITGYPEKNFGVSYANYRYTGAGESVTVGFSLFRRNASSHRWAEQRANVSLLLPPIWDRWFDEELRYDPQTGEVRYSIDGTERLAYNVGPLPPNASTLTLTFFPWGWYTGHSQEMDWVRVEQ